MTNQVAPYDESGSHVPLTRAERVDDRRRMRIMLNASLFLNVISTFGMFFMLLLASNVPLWLLVGATFAAGSSLLIVAIEIVRERRHMTLPVDPSDDVVRG